MPTQPARISKGLAPVGATSFALLCDVDVKFLRDYYILLKYSSVPEKATTNFILNVQIHHDGSHLKHSYTRHASRQKSNWIRDHSDCKSMRRSSLRYL
jgi:hypothetical protein